MKYEIAKDGEWMETPLSDYRIGCCDCGLIHDIDFKIKGKKLYRRVFRNDYETTHQREENPRFRGMKLPSE